MATTGSDIQPATKPKHPILLPTGAHGNQNTSVVVHFLPPRAAASADYPEDAVDRQLADLYYAAGDPAAYGGIQRLYQRAHELGIPADRDRVRRFLTEQFAYQLHKPVRHKFKRNQTIVGHKDDQWQADLAIMDKVSRANNNNHYILTCVDVLSRFAWAVPVRSKSAGHMLAAMRELFRMAAPRKPKRMQTDKGTEFYNARVRAFLRDQGVELFTTASDHKAALAERFNRTLKTLIYKHFTAYNTQRYVNVLPDLLYSYNHSRHRTIGCAPADVDGPEDERAVWKRVYYDSKEAQLRRADEYPSNRETVTDIGDRARLSRWKGEFEKGYAPSWTREQYEITGARAPRRGGMPRPVYKLKAVDGEDIIGYAYPEELQRIPPATHDVLEVEHVLRKRPAPDTHENETLVKFKGWPNKYNRWLSDEDLERYQQPPREQQRK